ncbi:MAG: glycosyltransferase [Limisphaerales bacterium]
MSRPSSDRRLMLYLPNLDGGGAEGVMVTLANGLAALGYHVDLVAATTGGVNEQNVSGGVNLVHLGASGCLASVPSLIRCLRKTRPQAIISTLSHANLAAIISNRLAGGNRRVIIRESAAIKLKSQYYGSLRTRLTQTGMRWLYPQASFVVANSPGLAGELIESLRVPPAKVRVIENPVIGEDFQALAGETLADPWFHDPRIPVVLGAGRLTVEKDFETLIRAFKTLRRKRPARLVILGEGKERQKLEGLVAAEGLQEAVKLPGYVRNPLAYMRLCGCFVLSSRFEGSPNVLIQALAAGAPVVSADCPWGPREILEEGNLGRLVAAGNAAALAAAVLETLAQPASPAQPGLLDKLREKYGAPAVLRKFEALLAAGRATPCAPLRPETSRRARSHAPCPPPLRP